jgi:hypothetical protein
MTRYAPTLFLGLGGSGVTVLRWLRSHLKRDLRDEPVVFCGIDFDRSNRDESNLPALAPGEFFYVEPQPIAECVRAMNNRAAGPPPKTNLAHEKIRLWYPDPDGKFIRYSQAEAAGARQWRPLGRVGFFLKDSGIMAAITRRLTVLERKRRQEPPSVMIISSVAGGTGSGMLLDVAALLRVKRRDLSIRAVLLLPEFFEQVDFGSKVAANGYATLWEIANFKNRIAFEADYPRENKIDARQSAPPLQRVYVVGPYMGNRRPFLSPGEAYPHVADLLRVLITAPLRADAQSFQTNDDADGNVSRSDPASAEIFCSFSSTSIAAIAWEELATLLARELAHETLVGPDDPHPLFDLLELPPSPSEIDDLAQLFLDAVKPVNAQKKLAADVVKAALKGFFDKETPAKWNKDELVQFTNKLQQFCDEFPNDERFVSHGSGPLRQACIEFEASFSDKLKELKSRFELHPATLRPALSRLRTRLHASSALPPSTSVLGAEDFAEWLDQRWSEWILSVPILRFVRIHRLRKHAEKKLRKRFEEFGPQLFEHAIFAAGRAKVSAALLQWTEQWAGSGDFAKQVIAAVDSRFITDDTRAIQRASLAHNDIDIIGALKAALSVVSVKIETGVRKDLLQRFHDKVIGWRSRPEAVEELPRDVDAALNPLKRRSTGRNVSKYVPLDLVYSSDQIRNAIASCVTPTFRTGRIDALLHRRTARIVLPKELADDPARRLAELCESELAARVQNVPTDDSADRVLILVEDLFHPAEDIAGIYDYQNAYRAGAHPELFHLDYRLLTHFPELLASTGGEGPAHCGNRDCSFDLRSTAPVTLLCPGCGRPIRNRCGNDCGLEGLSDRDDLADVIRAGICPRCKGSLKTYWWKCSRHGHRISMEKVHCPDCVREKRLHPEKRPGSSETYVCPACAGRGVDRPFTAAGRVAAASRRGVNGHDEHDTQEEIGRTLGNDRSCPKCGTQLIPYCPLTTSPPHFVHRPSDADRWCCYVHPQLELFACSVCDYPVEESDHACPRCQTSLANCAHCTGHVGLRVPSDAAMGRCVRCRLPLDGRSAAPATDDLFCSNIYICSAGSRLDELTFPKDLERCPLCSDFLRPVFARADLVGSCKFCSQMFPSCGSSSSQNRIDAGVCPLCWQPYSETSQHRLSEEELVVARALLDHRSDRKAVRQMYERTSAERRLELGDVLVALGSRIARGRHAKRIAQRVRDISDLLAELVPGAPTGSSSETMATPAGTTPHVTPHRRVDQLMSLEHMLELRSDDAVAEWVDELLSLKETTVSIRAALGTTLVDKHDDVRAHRLQEFRAAVSRRLDEIDHLGK